METKKMQTLFIALGFVFAVFAGILSFLQETHCGYEGGCGVDIAADGGAAGFAILAGLCFVALAITTLKSE